MLLEVEKVVAGYAGKKVLHEVSLNVGPGEIVALLGHNGAGKTTSLNTIFGLLPLVQGKVIFNGKDISKQSPKNNVKEGISLVPQGRGLFAELPVLANLKLGGYMLKNKAHIEERIEKLCTLFPMIKERRSQLAGTLSGGEQQILSLGMSLMMQPKLLLMDEPSLGLSPVLVERVMENVKEINRNFGTSILLVEQNLKQALSVAQRAYVMKMGKIILSESAKGLLDRESYWDLF